MIQFIEYPKCTTCKKAKKWLEEQQISFQDRHIKEENPTEAELQEWIEKSGLDIKKFFNTSGMLYKDLGLKDKLKEMTQEEKIKLLASDGMLVKRPIIVSNNYILVGFKEEQWKEHIK